MYNLRVFSVASIRESQQQVTKSLWVQIVKECIILEVEYSSRLRDGCIRSILLDTRVRVWYKFERCIIL